mmetsp:Transcript_26805/g.75215  ORF Transcript_26805/g.75215 Transcript_26805/m.75215 type:complete len:248 (-) Transcript_26805:2499-3242(-)
MKQRGSRHNWGVNNWNKSRPETVVALLFDRDMEVLFFLWSLLIAVRISVSITLCRVASSSSNLRAIRFTTAVCPVKRQFRGRAKIFSITPAFRHCGAYAGFRSSLINRSNVACITPGLALEGARRRIERHNRREVSDASFGSMVWYAGIPLNGFLSTGSSSFSVASFSSASFVVTSAFDSTAFSSAPVAASASASAVVFVPSASFAFDFDSGDDDGSGGGGGDGEFASPVGAAFESLFAALSSLRDA